jgi:hypothetical protein
MALGIAADFSVLIEIVVFLAQGVFNRRYVGLVRPLICFCDPWLALKRGALMLIES